MSYSWENLKTPPPQSVCITPSQGPPQLHPRISSHQALYTLHPLEDCGFTVFCHPSFHTHKRKSQKSTMYFESPETKNLWVFFLWGWGWIRSKQNHTKH